MSNLATKILPNVENIKKETNNIKHWYRKATVRTTDRIIVPSFDSDEYIFPPSRQPLVSHPLVISKGEETIGYILAQSAYQYMYDIGLLETRFVIDCSLNIVNNVIEGFSDVTKREALAVVIDEGYHAYVALDFIMQMKEQNKIEPLEVPHSNGNLDAVRNAYKVLRPEIHNHFQLISVTLAEHTLTKDLLAIGDEKNTTETFNQVMSDHVADEGRHASFFMTATTNYWPKLPEEVKVEIGQFLPAYIDEYLKGDETRDFDRKVLLAAGFSEQETQTILDDTHEEYMARMNSYIQKTTLQLVEAVEKMRMFDHEPTKQAFIAHGHQVD
ncbi:MULTISPECIES: diiron oxygenase [Pseudoalteromonas]|uniref:diiron oxygenase n=1 Tax=Pseudoalteromonas TaxID=53246 RepID=UPI000FFE7CE7|nr:MULTISPECIES: diiron oxygenase [Pseudoalteromonas]MCG9760809.1 diiron oxygenase [Pseudoalteromonas sp. Isolate6]NKC17340.1 hypothetical protein [Pseudoalteromonas galatheae]RXE84611.1 hypothetical protein DRB05_22095 [Pseudoalteromonas sp. A757]